MAQLSAANSHCTIIQHELGEVRVQLDNATKKKTRGSTKIKARFLTSKNMRAEFDKEDAERREKERVAAEKEKQKEADAAVRANQLANDAVNHTFSGKLKNYKKDDLRALALALKLSDLGNKEELNKRINNHFEDHPTDKDIPRFAPLFQPFTGHSRRECPSLATPQPPSNDSEHPENEQNERSPLPSTAATSDSMLPNDESQQVQHFHQIANYPGHSRREHPYHYPQLGPFQYSGQYYYGIPSTSSAPNPHTNSLPYNTHGHGTNYYYNP